MKGWKYFGALLLLVGMMGVLSGCDFGGGEHTHTFSKWAVTKAPTCVDTGVQSRECDECGYVESEKIDALGHSTSKLPAVKASCTTDGLTEGSACSVCGEVLQAQEVIPAHGHAPLKDYAVEATCTTQGLTEGSHCGICGAVIEAQTVLPATGHKYEKVTIVTPADCLHVGVKQFTCLWCDASYNDIYTTTEHTIVTDEAVAPTCTTDGLSQGSHCGVCNLVFAQQTVIPATGHREALLAAKEPTCTEVGLSAGTHCSICGVVMVEQKEIPALGHQNTEQILQEATCQKPGRKQLSCTVCGTVSEEDYELPHYADKDLYSAAVQFVGEIVTYDRSGNVLGNGIGFVISSDGRILTNYHVIEGAYAAQVTLHNVTYQVVSVLAYSKALDVAVLQIEAEGLPTAKLCAEPMADGAAVYALGAARGLTNTYTAGVILTAVYEQDGIVYVQHDAAITADNVGGPLMNVFGEVIGINMMATDGEQKHLALFASELDKLVYGEPITMAEFYAQTTSSYEKLLGMILSGGTKDGLGNVVIYDHKINADGVTIYSLGYEPATERIYLEMSVSSNGGNKTLVKLYLTGDPTALNYLCEFSIDGRTYNTMSGVLNAPQYTSASKLEYTGFQGMEGNEDFVVGMYQPKLNQALSWLDGYLQSHIEITLADIGFAVFTY